MWQKIKNIYHLFVAVLANAWFGFPSRKLTVIGVTGTDGKTTTVSLIYHILNKAGYNASMISSVGAKIGGKEYDLPFHVTTPSPWQLQRFLRKAIENAEVADENFFVHDAKKLKGSSRISKPASVHRKNFVNSPHSHYLVLEVTSHALDQHRIWGIDFEVGVLTNVTHEHLDYHKTYENYVRTKSKLLKIAKIAVANKDDNSFGVISNFQLVTYGMGKNAEINPQSFPFKTSLVGEFNRYNVLAAVGACRALGVADKDIKAGISSFVPPIGREEVVYQNNFTVMIDFAHTPNAIEQVLCSIRPQIKGRIIHVFGSAGKRDASKRPLMGAASSKYSDIIILTAEDPRSESVQKIITEIVSGVQNSEFRIQKGTLLEIKDRQEAINTAIKMARKGDLVIITGKAHEKSMNYGHGEESWDEFEAVKIALTKIKK